MHAGIEMCKTVDNVWGEVRILEWLGSNIFLPQALHDFREREIVVSQKTAPGIFSSKTRTRIKIEDSPGNL